MSNSSSNIAVVILAAGASKRMGTPKQLLKWGSTTLLEHTINTVLDLQTKEVVVVLGANYEVIESKINHHPITILKNEDWEVGLVKSLAFGVEYIKDSKHKFDACLVTLADQPFITSAFLNELIEAYQPKQNQIIATSYNDEKTGVPVIFDASYFEELIKLNDDSGAKHMLKKHKSFVKTFKPEIDNVDLDTKSDYKMFQK